jgi:amyloid beta precursor protein binding protein 1
LDTQLRALAPETELVQSNSFQLEEMALEFTRYSNAELPTIASVMGGVASQEAIKIITGQYVPLNNTYVYNGIASTAGVNQF